MIAGVTTHSAIVAWEASTGKADGSTRRRDGGRAIRAVAALALFAGFLVAADVPRQLPASVYYAGRLAVLGLLLLALARVVSPLGAASSRVGLSETGSWLPSSRSRLPASLPPT